MRIVSFKGAGVSRLAVRSGGRHVTLDPRGQGHLTGLGSYLRAGWTLEDFRSAVAAQSSSDQGEPAMLETALPLSDPGKTFCLGLNYLEHVKEGPYQVPDYPTIFMRGATSLVAHGQPIVRPLISDKLDFEAELAVIIGKKVRHATRENALDAVFGYSCFNDATLRDYQKRTVQWTVGKNFDSTGGFGPEIVTADELPPGAAGLKIESRLNGQVMQSDNTRNMMFPVAETIATITAAITLEPGDMIVMGTPSGVGYARKPPVFMKPGDVIEIEIEGIGTLRNPVVDEVRIA